MHNTRGPQIQGHFFVFWGFWCALHMCIQSIDACRHRRHFVSTRFVSRIPFTGRDAPPLAIHRLLSRIWSTLAIHRLLARLSYRTPELFPFYATSIVVVFLFSAWCGSRLCAHLCYACIAYGGRVLVPHVWISAISIFIGVCYPFLLDFLCHTNSASLCPVQAVWCAPRCVLIYAMLASHTTSVVSRCRFLYSCLCFRVFVYVHAGYVPVVVVTSHVDVFSFRSIYMAELSLCALLCIFPGVCL